MKPCSRHEAEITEALKRKGLWHLVATDTEEQMLRVRLWLGGRCPREKVDPLAITLLEIRQKAVLYCGDYLNSPRVEYCPLCETSRMMQRAELGTEWIDNCTDMVLLLCKVNELVPLS